MCYGLKIVQITPFPRSPQCQRSGVSPRKIFEISLLAIAVKELRRRRHKNATRRRVILAPVVNASSRRRRDLLVSHRLYMFKCYFYVF